ncbi:uncharacterized protein PGTG_12647 [Puccinia graminis f. sp. tritici CRL 75-36-700-3]|uniref:Uncharacterized protein n=1 Tax=Puccinia graminis f. sp. tritici (strain CRL 75-36-700-3 / race SCCL) TaxID=418459 RepID=E3KRI1_PUCGT|nr:uncharacterized protein PGTG_12647 [Puccinia graminis f. sp. tritici CRL 75-36-700-3]EFP86906.2 hypothetical protein PGTG_12647 [Puccinia graminis f. sp. tritici CRL 75-36-700-3]
MDDNPELFEQSNEDPSPAEVTAARPILALNQVASPINNHLSTEILENPSSASAPAVTVCQPLICYYCHCKGQRMAHCHALQKDKEKRLVDQKGHNYFLPSGAWIPFDPVRPIHSVVTAFQASSRSAPPFPAPYWMSCGALQPWYPTNKPIPCAAPLVSESYHCHLICKSLNIESSQPKVLSSDPPSPKCLAKFIKEANSVLNKIINLMVPGFSTSSLDNVHLPKSQIPERTKARKVIPRRHNGVKSISSGYEHQLCLTLLKSISFLSLALKSNYHWTDNLLGSSVMPGNNSTTTGGDSSADLNNASNLNVSGIVQLKPQGSDSNYLDWSFVVLFHLQSLNLSYVLEPVNIKERSAAYIKDSVSVSSFIAQTVHPSNLCFIRSHGSDAAGMWSSLSEAHQDFLSGGRMHWLCQLVVSRLVSNDIDTHIESMAVCAERLNSLVTADKPLTLDDIYLTALLTSLTDDWLPCVSLLMNEDSIPSSRIVSALKAESLRRKAWRKDDVLNAARVLSEHKSSRSVTNDHDSCRSNASMDTNCPSTNSCSSHPSSPTKPSVKAGQATVVELGYESYNEESDFSIPEHAGNTVVHDSPPASPESAFLADASIDSGCSISMTPDVSAVICARPDSTIVRLADSSKVSATLKGSTSLPLSTDKEVPAVMSCGGLELGTLHM